MSRVLSSKSDIFKPEDVYLILSYAFDIVTLKNFQCDNNELFSLHKLQKPLNTEIYKFFMKFFKSFVV